MLGLRPRLLAKVACGPFADIALIPRAKGVAFAHCAPACCASDIVCEVIRREGLLRDYGMSGGDMPGALCKARPGLALGAGRISEQGVVALGEVCRRRGHGYVLCTRRGNLVAQTLVAKGS